MTFGENITSTFIGAFLAFTLGIIAFYITENIRRSSIKDRLKTAFLKELDYNVRLINQQIGILTEIIEDIAANRKPINKYFSLRNHQRSHLDQYYLQGHAFDHFSPDDILAFSIVLDYVVSPRPDAINQLVKEWNENTTTLNVANELMRERDYLNQIIVAYESVYQKLNNA